MADCGEVRSGFLSPAQCSQEAEEGRRKFIWLYKFSFKSEGKSALRLTLHRLNVLSLTSSGLTSHSTALICTLWRQELGVVTVKVQSCIHERRKMIITWSSFDTFFFDLFWLQLHQLIRHMRFFFVCFDKSVEGILQCCMCDHDLIQRGDPDFQPDADRPSKHCFSVFWVSFNLFF